VLDVSANAEALSNLFCKVTLRRLAIYFAQNRSGEIGSFVNARICSKESCGSSIAFIDG
jgi:hypothetical protein